MPQEMCVRVCVCVCACVCVCECVCVCTTLLQRVDAARCNSWPSAAHDILQLTATHCNTLQHMATHCNTPQHSATHCAALQYFLICACHTLCGAALKRVPHIHSIPCCVAVRCMLMHRVIHEWCCDEWWCEMLALRHVLCVSPCCVAARRMHCDMCISVYVTAAHSDMHCDMSLQHTVTCTVMQHTVTCTVCAMCVTVCCSECSKLL